MKIKHKLVRYTTDGKCGQLFPTYCVKKWSKVTCKKCLKYKNKRIQK